ncbi:hypothetical protein [Pendulispora albinea]|uniref:SCP domain-containing protein n=1 Tax=Pendulispora albinea TaxID=2741071 RepID=A0ABZ2LQZ4_9BACT
MKALRSLACMLVTVGIFGSSMTEVYAQQPEAVIPPECQQLTPVNIQRSIDVLNAIVPSLNADVAFCSANPCRYSAAPTNALAGLTYARDKMVEIQTLIRNYGGPDATEYVRNASLSYGLYNAGREAIDGLHVARHWATISKVYHGSTFVQNGVTYSRRDTILRLTSAMAPFGPLSSNATMCYADQYP